MLTGSLLVRLYVLLKPNSEEMWASTSYMCSYLCSVIPILMGRVPQSV